MNQRPVLRRWLLIAAIVALAAGFAQTRAGGALERLVFDAVVAWGAPPASGKVVLVAIDDRALDRYGHWPWPRALQARLLRAVQAAGARAVALDVAYPGRADGDAALAAAIEDAGNVVLPVLIVRGGGYTPLVERLPPPSILDAAAAIGHSDVDTDPDGVVRRAHLWAGVGEAHWPALALAAAKVGGITELPPSPPAVASGTDPLAWQRAVPRLLRLPARPGVRQVSAAAVMAGGTLGASLDGAFVVVGLTAGGEAPFVTLVADNQARMVPGSLYQALLLDRLLTGGLAPPLPRGLSAAAVALLGLLPFGVLGLGWTALVAALVLPLAAGLSALSLGGVWLPFASGLFVAKIAMLLIALQAQARLRYEAHVERTRAHTALEAIADAVVTVDDAGRIAYANQAAHRLSGLDQMLGRSLADAPPILKAAEAGHCGNETALIEIATGCGDRRAMRTRTTALEAPKGKSAVITLSDVTTEQRLMREVAWQATHDALTGLPNRSLLQERLTEALAAAERRRQRLALAFLDLDRLKRINDELGHAAGDVLIDEAVKRMVATARAGDTLARFGGDEFIVLLEGPISRADAVSALERMIEEVRAPMQIAGQILHAEASVGIAFYPDHASGAADLLRRADAAMYAAKTRRRGPIVVFEPHMESRSDAGGGLRLIEELRCGINDGELRLHYQPRVRLADGILSGLEALVRWQHPTRGLLGPNAFIGLAEETGLMVDLGRWVIDATLAECRGALVGRPDLRLSLNLSAVQLEQDANLVDFVRQSLHRHDLPPERLELEVTEGLFLDPALSVVGRRLCELAEIGCPLAIDDFGTGYSALGYLTRFPFERIKIDRSFIQGIEKGAAARAIVEAIVALSASLGKSTTAEGIEHEAQQAVLKHLGCDEGQGYYFAKPGPLGRVLN